MNVELDLPCPYKVTLDTSRSVYTFHTDTGADYEVLFQDYSSLFTSTIIESAEIFSMILNKKTVGTKVKDPKVQKTVSAIFDHFFQEKNRLLLYQCDDTDGRELSRKRLFEGWYNTSRSYQNYVKLEAKIQDGSKHYYGVLIHHKDNIYGSTAISDSFDIVVYTLQEAK